MLNLLQVFFLFFFRKLNLSFQNFDLCIISLHYQSRNNHFLERITSTAVEPVVRLSSEEVKISRGLTIGVVVLLIFQQQNNTNT